MPTDRLSDAWHEYESAHTEALGDIRKGAQIINDAIKKIDEAMERMRDSRIDAEDYEREKGT